MSKPAIIEQIANSLRQLKALSRSQKGKEILTFSLFVILAACIWFILAINDNRESTVKIPLELTEVPNDVVLLQDLPPYIEARIRDKGASLLTYQINGISPIKIDFNSHSNQRDAIVLGSTSLVEHARRQLRATTTIHDFTPDTIRIAYTRDKGKRVPITIDGNFTTSPYSTFSDSAYTTPDSVTIYGKATTLNNISAVSTEELLAHQLSDTTYLKARIKPIDGTRLIPDSVTVVVPIEEYTTKTLSIPIVIEGAPNQYTVMTFPSHVTLTCLVPISQYAHIVSDDFLVGNTFDEIQSTPGANGAIKVLNAPHIAHNIILSQDSVEYIISENINKNTTPPANNTQQ